MINRGLPLRKITSSIRSADLWQTDGQTDTGPKEDKKVVASCVSVHADTLTVLHTGPVVKINSSDHEEGRGSCGLESQRRRCMSTASGSAVDWNTVVQRRENDRSAAVFTSSCTDIIIHLQVFAEVQEEHVRPSGRPTLSVICSRPDGRLVAGRNGVGIPPPHFCQTAFLLRLI